MRAVVQRVSRARVMVGGDVVGEIGDGLLVLVGVATGDTESDADVLAAKVAGLRILPDGEGRMNRSVAEARGAVLVVSQFTLLADVARGRRPSFTGAADPSVAEPLVARVTAGLEEAGLAVARGRFGAHMLVESVNDGPVTILLEAAEGRIR
ncbi:MAG TPA: D-aminoacyl-tRNA deacylase [Acidimicrobiia bacterium]|nr:D-aminoacyl-tRNA deacylase [Acidimicrobiia bacterium]